MAKEDSIIEAEPLIAPLTGSDMFIAFEVMLRAIGIAIGYAMVSLTLPMNGITGLGLYAPKKTIGRPLNIAKSTLRKGDKSLKSSRKPTKAAIIVEENIAKQLLLDSGIATLRRIKDSENPISIDIPTLSGILGLLSLCTSTPIIPLLLMSDAILGVDIRVAKKLIAKTSRAYTINVDQLYSV